jgi:hypothetical protein
LNEQVLKDIIKLFFICKSAWRKVEISLKGRDFWSFAIPRSGAPPARQRRAKPAKIISLIEKDFCTRTLKDLVIFAGFVRRPRRSRFATLRRRQAASRWASEVSVRIFSEKGSDFVQYAEPFRIRQRRRLAATPDGA